MRKRFNESISQEEHEVAIYLAVALVRLFLGARQTRGQHPFSAASPVATRIVPPGDLIRLDGVDLTQLGVEVGRHAAIYSAGVFLWCEDCDHKDARNREMIAMGIKMAVSFGLLAPAIFTGPAGANVIGIFLEPLNKLAAYIAEKIIKNKHRVENMILDVNSATAHVLSGMDANNQDLVSAMAATYQSVFKVAIDGRLGAKVNAHLMKKAGHSYQI